MAHLYSAMAGYGGPAYYLPPSQHPYVPPPSPGAGGEQQQFLPLSGMVLGLPSEAAAPCGWGGVQFEQQAAAGPQLEYGREQRARCGQRPPPLCLPACLLAQRRSPHCPGAGPWAGPRAANPSAAAAALQGTAWEAARPGRRRQPGAGAGRRAAGAGASGRRPEQPASNRGAPAASEAPAARRAAARLGAAGGGAGARGREGGHGAMRMSPLRRSPAACAAPRPAAAAVLAVVWSPA